MGVLHDGEGTSPDGRGRPATTIELQPTGLCIFALVIRSDETNLYLIDALGNYQECVHIPITSTDTYQNALEKYAQEINNLLGVASQAYAVTAGIGVSFAGWVDAKAGTISTPSKFLDWHNRTFAQDLSRLTGLQCFIDNDAVSLTRAAFWFSNKVVTDSFALLYLDIGLGTGFCFHQRIYTGQNHISAGLAHTNLFGWSDEKCHCGRTGCLETVLSIGAALRRAEALGIQFPEKEPLFTAKNLGHLEREAQAGSLDARAILTDLGKKAAVVGAAVCRMLDLPMVVYAGGLPELSEVFWSSVVEEMSSQSANLKEPVNISRLNEVLEHHLPEALGASAVALGGLYQSRSVILLKDSMQPS
jgi:predicted NBD/HSP70 family sugar kinase